MKGIEFDIKPEDLVMPKRCPLLGVELIMYTDTQTSHEDKDKLWSIDRRDPSKGYVKGNVWIVSYRANQIKSDATLEELETIARNLRIELEKGNQLV